MTIERTIEPADSLRPGLVVYLQSKNYNDELAYKRVTIVELLPHIDRAVISTGDTYETSESELLKNGPYPNSEDLYRLVRPAKLFKLVEKTRADKLNLLNESEE